MDTNIINRALNMGGVIVNTRYFVSHMTLACTKVLKVQSDPIHGSPNDIPRGIFGLLLMFSSGIPLVGFPMTLILNSLQILLLKNDRNAVIVFKYRPSLLVFFWNRLHVL